MTWFVAGSSRVVYTGARNPVTVATAHSAGKSVSNLGNGKVANTLMLKHADQGNFIDVMSSMQYIT